MFPNLIGVTAATPVNGGNMPRVIGAEAVNAGGGLFGLIIAALNLQAEKSSGSGNIQAAVFGMDKDTESSDNGDREKKGLQGDDPPGKVEALSPSMHWNSLSIPDIEFPEPPSLPGLKGGTENSGYHVRAVSEQRVCQLPEGLPGVKAQAGLEGAAEEVDTTGDEVSAGDKGGVSRVSGDLAELPVTGKEGGIKTESDGDAGPQTGSSHGKTGGVDPGRKDSGVPAGLSNNKVQVSNEPLSGNDGGSSPEQTVKGLMPEPDGQGNGQNSDISAPEKGDGILNIAGHRDVSGGGHREMNLSVSGSAETRDVPDVPDEEFMVKESQAGSNRVKLTIRPDGLGKIDLTVGIKDGHLRAEFAVERIHSLLSIQNNMSQLFDSLSGDGWTSGRFSFLLKDDGKRGGSGGGNNKTAAMKEPGAEDGGRSDTGMSTLSIRV
ncbi:flagellar hook-length control protein FliK [bacterium BMS3Bbin06]|nr:flagellar hook-length control protein FliK [bacterium BMS3Abin08]GBE33844.1 flagellar hook-length control protein FliK [bacterium BMS3Bbin06]